MENFKVNDDTVEGTCEDCGELVIEMRNSRDMRCECGALYNSYGQRLRDNAYLNPSNYDEEVGDMEGYEQSFYGEE